jgi:NTP pyrophosphatase (non-canonical NTP hydrolase)
MADADTTVATLKEMVRRFAAERSWEPYHSPKNLAMGLAVEAAELMEHFLWVESEASRQVVQDAGKLAEIGEELADVANHLFNLCNVLGIDLSDAFRVKLVKNALKYPAPPAEDRTGE